MIWLDFRTCRDFNASSVEICLCQFWQGWISMNFKFPLVFPLHLLDIISSDLHFWVPNKQQFQWFILLSTSFTAGCTRKSLAVQIRPASFFYPSCGNADAIRKTLINHFTDGIYDIEPLVFYKHQGSNACWWLIAMKCFTVHHMRASRRCFKLEAAAALSDSKRVGRWTLGPRTGAPQLKSAASDAAAGAASQELGSCLEDSFLAGIKGFKKEGQTHPFFIFKKLQF